MTRRLLAVALGVLLVVGAGVAVAVGRGGLPGTGTVPVRGVIGSEKEEFFDDERVRARFAELGYDVAVDTAGSRQIGTQALGQADYDFASPSSRPTADLIETSDDVVVLGAYEPFFSPIAVLTFADVAGLLETAGLAAQDPDGVWTFDMAAYLAAAQAGLRWRDIPGNTGGEVFDSPQTVRLTSTDVTQSNSAAMYLAIASYVVNGDDVVTTAEEETRVLPCVAGLFADQGYTEESTRVPFEDYLSQGKGRVPMMIGYESLFLEAELAGLPQGGGDERVLMYPEPTVFSQHVVLSFTEPGDAVGRLLDEDPELQELLAEYGFRVSDPTVFAGVLDDAGVEQPPDVDATAGIPAYEVLERLVVALEDVVTGADDLSTDCTLPAVEEQ